MWALKREMDSLRMPDSCLMKSSFVKDVNEGCKIAWNKQETRFFHVQEVKQRPI